MPYKDPLKHREYQRIWMNKRNRSLGVPVRPKGECKVKRDGTKAKWRWGEMAEVHDLLIELEIALGINQYYSTKINNS